MIESFNIPAQYRNDRFIRLFSMIVQKSVENMTKLLAFYLLTKKNDEILEIKQITFINMHFVSFLGSFISLFHLFICVSPCIRLPFFSFLLW